MWWREYTTDLIIVFAAVHLIIQKQNNNNRCRGKTLNTSLLHLVFLAVSKRWKAKYLLWVLCCRERLENNRVGKLVWSTLPLPASNSFWEGGTSAPLLFPAQFYDNPNKLWCSAQTLKTLIGCKSNRLSLSGQWELGSWLCVPDSPF